MKKLYLPALLFFLFSQLVFSQNYRFGIKGGLNYCDLNGPDKPATLDQDLGFNAGLYLDSRVGQFLYTQFELNFLRYNFHFDENVDIVDQRRLAIEEQNNYISIPAMLKYKRGYEFIFIYANIGMQANILIHSNRKSELYINDLKVDTDYYYGFNNSRIDYGPIAGIGFQVQAVNIDLKYYMSTRNLYKESNARELRYESVSLNLAYQFNYKTPSKFGRKTGWKGVKYKIKHMFK
jgi:hypothetical protein